MPALYLVSCHPNWENDKMHTAPSKLSIHCPAKINLNLAVTGQRADGFHELVSLVAPLELGDELEVSWSEEGQAGKAELLCDDPDLPVDERNLVIRAIRAYREVHAFAGSLQCRLTKLIPAGAGLGGGSSDAAGLLLALNQLLGSPLDDTELCDVAATIGSDCPLFLAQKPVIMRGRGEALEALSPRAARVLAGQPVLLFKPPSESPLPGLFP